jgi:hypothetical protein
MKVKLNFKKKTKKYCHCKEINDKMKLGQNQNVLLKQCVVELNVPYDEGTLKFRTFEIYNQGFGKRIYTM